MTSTRQADGAAEVEALVHPRPDRVRLWVVAHLIAGTIAFWLPQGGTIYAYVVLVQVGVVVLRSRRIDDAVVAMAYVCSVEVLWRMSHARVPWEAAKYVVIIACAVTLLRHRWASVAALPVIFMALLLPSAMVTVTELGVGGSREALASYLLGPISLGMTVLLCTGLTATREALARVCWALFLPALTVATYQTWTLATAQDLVFGDDSNNVAAGNFGANQVATALSIGLVGLFVLLVVLGKGRHRGLLIALGVWLLVCSLMTFSRGGLVSFGAAAVLASIQMVTDVRRLIRALLLTALAAILLFAVLVPQLDAATGGFLSERFSDSSTTHRTSIAEGDYELFLQHPWVGVGVGLGPASRLGSGAPSHTEYTRLLSEHGALGLLAVLVMIVMAVQAVSRARGRPARAWALMFIPWSMVTMFHADMRLAAVGFLFGVGCLNWPASEQPALR